MWDNGECKQERQCTPLTRPYTDRAADPRGVHDGVRCWAAGQADVPPLAGAAPRLSTRTSTRARDKSGKASRPGAPPPQKHREHT